jgi:hypothetical protein
MPTRRHQLTAKYIEKYDNMKASRTNLFENGGSYDCQRATKADWNNLTTAKIAGFAAPLINCSGSQAFGPTG